MIKRFSMKKNNLSILHKEETFHDKWAQNEDTELDFVKVVEASTSPEIRFILKEMGDVYDKEILDIGSGLGEFGLYLSKRGAKVTLLDISSEMLNFSKKVADKHSIEIDTLHGDIINLKIKKKFDFIYAGNYLHHVDIKENILIIKNLLKKNGKFFSWDPLKYNFFINVYRKIATDVRTEDEHPLSIEDINLIKKNFTSIKAEYYWFLSLFTFLYMVFIKFKNPNKTRLWKEVVNKSNHYRFIFIPLNLLDRLILNCFPFLKKFCWNVVLVCKK